MGDGGGYLLLVVLLFVLSCFGVFIGDFGVCFYFLLFLFCIIIKNI